MTSPRCDHLHSCSLFCINLKVCGDLVNQGMMVFITLKACFKSSHECTERDVDLRISGQNLLTAAGEQLCVLVINFNLCHHKGIVFG